VSYCIKCQIREEPSGTDKNKGHQRFHGLQPLYFVNLELDLLRQIETTDQREARIRRLRFCEHRPENSCSVAHVGTVWLPPVQAQPLNELLSYTKAAVPAGESVFAVPYYPLFYFISGLDHATRFIDLRPGSPGPTAEDEMIADLGNHPIDGVLYFVGLQFAGGESFEDAYPRLHHYLMTHFALYRTIGTYFGRLVEIRRRHAPRAD